ncbi:MAG: acetolactate synthase large subunit [Gammaproteobacteria bacterium]|nr:acetolactate synthase large subunit [Gammaproteobacteria bacterium]
MKTTELIVKCLESEGVEYIFGVPGEENMDLLDALLGSSIRFVMTRHEQGAAFMADVYGRLTGKAGGCLSTLGPGATNLITGVADANMDRAPVVALPGQADRDRLHKESHQHLDIVTLFRPVTKWNTSLPIPGIIPEVFRKAFKLAQSEKPGATHIEIPEDVARMETDGQPLRVQWLHPGGAAAAQIDKGARLISQATHPVVLAGNGVIRGRASEALMRFAARLNIPVATTYMAKGVIADTHPLALGAIGLHSADYVNCEVADADVVIAVGYDVVEFAPHSWNPKHDKKIVHVDMSFAEVDASYIVDVGVVGDIASSLDALAQLATPHPGKHVLPFRQMLRDELELGSRDASFPLKPQRILADLRAALADDDIVISDVGAHKLWLARLFPCLVANTSIISNGFAAMGMAVPGAVAAKLVHPNRRVVAVTGDGGFLMNSQELETATRLETPFVVLVFNDQGYGLIRWKQMLQFGRPAFVDFQNQNLVKYAESLGANGFAIESADQLAPTLRTALNSHKLSIIDCPVDVAENLNLTQRLGTLVMPTGVYPCIR